MTSATEAQNLRNCLPRTTAKINKLFKADDSYRSVIISGSGTSSNETVLSSIFNPGEKVMLVRNGVFGERITRDNKQV